MKVFFHHTFKKRYKKLPKKIRVRFDERVYLLLKDPQHPLLNKHIITEDGKRFFSINVTGDYRAIYLGGKNMIKFYKIGTHSQLY